MFPKTIVTVLVLAFVVYAECRPSYEELSYDAKAEKLINLICEQVNEPWDKADDWEWEQVLHVIKAGCEALNLPVSTTTTVPSTVPPTVPSTVPSTNYPTTSWITTEHQPSETTSQPTTSAGNQE